MALKREAFVGAFLFRAKCKHLFNGCRELVFLAGNAFHPLKEEFANEISTVFNLLAADTTSVIQMFTADSIFLPLD